MRDFVFWTFVANVVSGTLSLLSLLVSDEKRRANALSLVFTYAWAVWAAILLWIAP